MAGPIEASRQSDGSDGLKSLALLEFGVLGCPFGNSQNCGFTTGFLFRPPTFTSRTIFPRNMEPQTLTCQRTGGVPGFSGWNQATVGGAKNHPPIKIYWLIHMGSTIANIHSLFIKWGWLLHMGSKNTPKKNLIPNSMRAETALQAPARLNSLSTLSPLSSLRRFLKVASSASLPKRIQKTPQGDVCGEREAGGDAMCNKQTVKKRGTERPFCFFWRGYPSTLPWNLTFRGPAPFFWQRDPLSSMPEVQKEGRLSLLVS